MWFLPESFKVVVDLYFSEIPPPNILSLSKEVPGSREWIAHCGSMSKVLRPGLRVGWMIAQPELLAKATMCKQFSDANTSTRGGGGQVGESLIEAV